MRKFIIIMASGQAVSDYSKEEIHKQFIDNCPGILGVHRDYVLPKEGVSFWVDHLQFQVYGELDATPNPQCRYSRSHHYYEFAVSIPYWDRRPKCIDLSDPNAEIPITVGGTPETWGKYIKLSVKDYDKYLSSPVTFDRRWDLRSYKNIILDGLYRLFK